MIVTYNPSRATLWENQMTTRAGLETNFHTSNSFLHSNEISTNPVINICHESADKYSTNRQIVYYNKKKQNKKNIQKVAKFDAHGPEKKVHAHFKTVQNSFLELLRACSVGIRNGEDFHFVSRLLCYLVRLPRTSLPFGP